MEWLSAPLGFSRYESAVALSALGTALGVLLAHRASSALGMSRSAALLTTALVAASPAVVFFATVVEIHGAFFAFAGLAMLAAARSAARPTVARGVAFGGAMALAFCVHRTGALLPLALVPVAWLGGPPRAVDRRRVWPCVLVPTTVLAASAIAVHVALPRPAGSCPRATP